MANIRKSFNFRNGVQVDNDHFIVNANGLVGIGSSAPTSRLDVSGNMKVDGGVTSSTLSSGIGTITNFTSTHAKVGVLTATSLSIGDNLIANLIGYAFTAWSTDNGGIGLHTTSKIAINAEKSPGESDSELNVYGDANITGILTANSFSGNLYGNVIGDLTGNVNSGVSTFTKLKVGTAITMSAGIISATTFSADTVDATTLSGSLETSNLSGQIKTNQIRDEAVTTDKILTLKSEKLRGALPAISGASLTDVSAVSIKRDVDVNLGVTTTKNLTAESIVGTGLSVTSIGIGTAIPANTFQQRATGATKLQVTSDTASASVTVGREPGTNNTNNAEFRYGGGSAAFPYSNSESLDLINYGKGNFNYYLSANNPGVAEGNYIWHKGSNSDPLMSLTKDGYLGIGIEDPQHELSVQGISTFTGKAHFNDAVIIDGKLSLPFNSLTGTLEGDVQDTTSNIVVDVSKKLFLGNVDTSSGISTFNNSKIQKLGISTPPDASNILSVCSNQKDRFHITGDGNVGIKTISTNTNIELDVNGDVQARHGLVIGQTTEPKCIVDMSSVVDIVADGTPRASIAYMIPPRVTDVQRTALRRANGDPLGPNEKGAMIYNTVDDKLQVWDGGNWRNCF